MKFPRLCLVQSETKIREFSIEQALFNFLKQPSKFVERCRTMRLITGGSFPFSSRLRLPALRAIVPRKSSTNRCANPPTIFTSEFPVSVFPPLRLLEFELFCFFSFFCTRERSSYAVRVRKKIVTILEPKLIKDLLQFQATTRKLLASFCFHFFKNKASFGRR